MNIVDVVLIIAIIMLFLTILGVMREAVILRGHVTALSQLIVSPPAPTFLGKPLPVPLVSALAPIHRLAALPPQPHVVVFVSAGCGGCTHLSTQLQQAMKLDPISPDGLSFVVSATCERAPIFQVAQTVTRNVVLDTTGALLKAGEIKGTPPALAIWTDRFETFDYKIGGDVGWIRQKLQQRKSALPRTNGSQSRPVLREAPFDQEVQPADASSPRPASSSLG